MKKLLITAILLASWSHHSTATTASNELLLDQCTSKQVGPSNFCSGLLIGFYQSYTMIQDFVIEQNGLVGNADYEGYPHICVSKSVTPKQLKLVVVKYIKDHPEDLHKHLSTGILGGFYDAFLCNEEEFLKHIAKEFPAK